MIQIKKPQGTQLITTTVDCSLFDFTFLKTAPQQILPAITNKIIIPVCVTCDYYSTGSQIGGFYIYSDVNAFTVNDCFFCWLSNGVVADQSGIVTYQFYGTAPFSPGNNGVNHGLNLTTANDEINASYIKFMLSITYFIIDSL